MADTWITDTGASTRFPVYTRANASDVLPGPVSPLGATLSWIPGLMEGWRDGNIRQGAFSVEEVAGDPNPVCAIFNGYFYVNASVVRVYGERAGAGAAAIDAAFFGNRPDTPPYVPHPDDQSEAAAERIGSTMAWVMSATEWPEMEESKRRADAARAERPDLAAASDAELVARAREMTQLEREFFSDHVLSSSNTAVGPTIVGQIAPAQMLRLLGSAGDVDSALPSYELWHLSREVRESPELTAAFEAGVAGLLERLRAEDDDDAAALLDHLDRFLEDYGARGPNEWDAYSDVWESQPELVLALVDRMRLAGDEQSPRRPPRRRRRGPRRGHGGGAGRAGRRRGHQGPPAGRAGLGAALHGLAGADQDQLREGRPRAAHGPARARPASGRAGRARPTEAGVHAPGRRARRLRRRPGRVPRPLPGAGGRVAPPVGPRAALLHRGRQGRAAAQLAPRQGRRGRDRRRHRATSSRAAPAARAWSRGRRG